MGRNISDRGRWLRRHRSWSRRRVRRGALPSRVRRRRDSSRPGDCLDDGRAGCAAQGARRVLSPEQAQTAGPFARCRGSGPSARCRGSYPRVNGRRRLAPPSSQTVASTTSRSWSSTAVSSIVWSMLATDMPIPRSPPGVPPHPREARLRLVAPGDQGWRQKWLAGLAWPGQPDFSLSNARAERAVDHDRRGRRRLHVCETIVHLIP